jgi:hypothetical protein
VVLPYPAPTALPSALMILGVDVLTSEDGAGWTPTLPAATPGRFELADLLRFAKVLPAATPPP